RSHPPARARRVAATPLRRPHGPPRLQPQGNRHDSSGGIAVLRLGNRGYTPHPPRWIAAQSRSQQKGVSGRCTRWAFLRRSAPNLLRSRARRTRTTHLVTVASTKGAELVVILSSSSALISPPATPRTDTARFRALPARTGDAQHL